MWRDKQFVHLIANALTADLLEFCRLARNGVHCLWLNGEVELSGKTHGTHQTQWIFVEAFIGFIAYGAQDMVFEVLATAEGVADLAAQWVACHGVDGEVASTQVLL